MPNCRFHPPLPRPEPFSPLPLPGHVPDWGKWIRDRLAEKGALLAFPSASEFPDPGAQPNVYEALDTGTLYRWDGAHYQVLVDPSAANDVLEYEGREHFPETGEHGKLYIAADTGSIYRWGGEDYVALLPGKADKCVPAAEGSLAALTRDGNLADSGIPAAAIPSDASASNPVATKSFVNSSIATNTATFRGTYNLVTDLGLTVAATEQQVAAALAAKLASFVPPVVPENNDYCFVQVPYDETPVDPEHIERIDRYKCTVTESGGVKTRTWGYEFSLNKSSFTAAQWAAINSGITSGLVAKLGALPTAEALAQTLAGKQDALTFDNAPTTGSDNPVKSGGIWSAIWGTASTAFSSLYDWVVSKFSEYRHKLNLNVYGYGNASVSFPAGYSATYGSDTYTAPSGGETIEFYGPITSTAVPQYNFWVPTAYKDATDFDPQAQTVWCLFGDKANSIPDALMYGIGALYNIANWNTEAPTLTLSYGEASGGEPVMARPISATGDTLAKASQLDGKLDKSGGTMTGTLTVPIAEGLRFGDQFHTAAVQDVQRNKYLMLDDGTNSIAIPIKNGTAALTAGTGHAGNLAALDSRGNPTDSGKKAGDFATAAQGTKADTAIQGVKVNGTAIAPDAQKKVNLEVATEEDVTLTDNAWQCMPAELIDPLTSRNLSVEVRYEDNAWELLVVGGSGDPIATVTPGDPDARSLEFNFVWNNEPTTVTATRAYQLGDQSDKLLQPAGDYVPTSRTVNGKALTGNVTLTGADIAVSGTDATKIDAALAGKASKSDVDPLLFAQYYPDGSVKSAAEFTQGIKYNNPDTVNRTITVRPFCDTVSSADNSGLIGRVVIPPFVDVGGYGYISDNGKRYKVVGVHGGISRGVNTNLTAIVAPTTVTNIGAFAFVACTALTSVSLPTVTSIGNEAFNYCLRLDSVDFGDTPRSSVPTLGADAFLGVPTSCTIIVPYTQYDAWIAADGWKDLPQEFVRHAEKADKPATFTTGNLAKFDSEGNPTDSGIKVGVGSDGVPYIITTS